MNNPTSEALSILCKNKNIFEFTQLHGLHGVALQNTEEPDKSWFNPKFKHTLGYNAEQTLSWKKLTSKASINKIERIQNADNYTDDLLSGEIRLLHQKGFSISLTYKAILTDNTVVITIKKVNDYSHLEYNPNLDFEREQMLDTVLETIDVGVIACDKEGKLTLFNKAAKKWHGLPAADIPQSEYASYYNLYHPDGKTLFRTEELGLIDMLQNGKISNPEMLIKPKSEKERFIIASGARLYDDEKNVSGAVVALHNITDYKETEEKLRLSEKTFRGSFKNAADGMAITDATGTCIEVNDRLCEIMGYSASELKTLNFQEVTYPEDLEEDLKLWTELLKGERDFYQIQKRAIHKSGEIKHIIVAVAIVRDENNEPFHFITQITDISSLKEAENQLKVSEEMFRETFENAYDGMAISDVHGEFIKLNDSLCKMVGYSQEELIKLNFLDITHPDDIEKDLKAMKEMLSSEKDYIQNEKRFINKNGSHVHVILSVSMVRDIDSNPIYFIAQMTEITELKLAQKELNRILNITKEQNSRLNNFAHIVSHNLRAHSGNIEMLLDIYTDENPETKEDEVIQMALTASEKLKETIKDLNEVAFINMSVSQKIIPINLRKSVDETLSSINALIKKADMQVLNTIPADLEVLAVPAYMESIVLNFATNALKYRSDARRPILRFEAVKEDEYIKLFIKDNGIGIDLEKYGKDLFGMYKTFHQNEDAKGIGLFITKNQIEAIGGKIKVESEVNKGTVFTIYFNYNKN